MIYRALSIEVYISYPSWLDGCFYPRILLHDIDYLLKTFEIRR